jgi:hypothetical protein
MARVLATDPVGFTRNLELLMTLIKQGGADALLFGFLEAPPERVAQVRPDLAPLEPAFLAGLHKNTEAMRKLAAQHAIPFVEPQPERFRPEWFLDSCHLTEEGESMKASIIFEALMTLPRIQRALDDE